MIPGSNLLNMALGLISAQAIGWRQYQGKTRNPAGIEVATWAAPVIITGSFQPIDTTMLQRYGLDLSQEYATFYSSQGFTDPERDKTGDKLTYGSDVWQVKSKCPWLMQDGWTRVLCVRLTNETA